MIIVTGAAGFIGSNLVEQLNARGERDILAVDNFERPDKFRNLVDLEISDYLDKREFPDWLKSKADIARDGGIRAIFHQGACSDTMETDGRYMMQNNYRYTMDLLEFCTSYQIPLIYASSAAVYGGGEVFEEKREHESPLNIYGYSKFLFDQVVRARLAGQSSGTQIVGLRYFNVYGPRESHKARMASVAFHHVNQFRDTGCVKLFGGWDGYGEGEQSRDFVYVKDAVAVNLFFFDNPQLSGIFNCGTGRAQPFNDIAHTVVNTLREQSGESALSREQMVKDGLLAYIDFPEALKGKYQSYTRADLAQLREIGCDHSFASVQDGVAEYVRWLIRQ